MLTGLCLPCVSFESAPMSTPRRQYRDLFSLHREMDGESRLAFFLHPARQPGATAQPRAEPGPPHVVRIRTDIFRRRGKCPRCRVRWGGTGRSFPCNAGLFIVRAAVEFGKFAQRWPRPCPPPHARIRTLCPAAKAFVSRRTTRRAGRNGRGSPCLSRRPLAPSAALC